MEGGPLQCVSSVCVGEVDVDTGAEGPLGHPGRSGVWSKIGIPVEGKRQLESPEDTACGHPCVAIPIANFQTSLKSVKGLTPKTGALLLVGLMHEMRS